MRRRQSVPTRPKSPLCSSRKHRSCPLLASSQPRRAIKVQNILMKSDTLDPGKIHVYVDGNRNYTFVRRSTHWGSRTWFLVDATTAELVARLRVSRLLPYIKMQSPLSWKFMWGTHSFFDWQVVEWSAHRTPDEDQSQLSSQRQKKAIVLRWRKGDWSLIRMENGRVHLPAVATIEPIKNLGSWHVPFSSTMRYRKRWTTESQDTHELQQVVATGFVSAWIWARDAPAAIAAIGARLQLLAEECSECMLEMLLSAKSAPAT